MPDLGHNKEYVFSKNTEINDGIIFKYKSPHTFTDPQELVSKAYVDSAPVSHLEQDNYFCVGDAGNDSNGGRSQDDALKTIGTAITKAIAAVPSASNQFNIYIVDGNNYIENVTLPSYVHLIGPAASITGTITINDWTSIHVNELHSTGTNPVIISNMTASTQRCYINIDSHLKLFDGNGIAGGTTPNNQGEIYLNSSLITVDSYSLVTTSFKGSLFLRMNHIIGTGAGTTIFDVDTCSVEISGISIRNANGIIFKASTVAALFNVAYIFSANNKVYEVTSPHNLHIIATAFQESIASTESGPGQVSLIAALGSNTKLTLRNDLGIDIFDDTEVASTKFITYASHPTFTADEQLIDKKYTDDLVGSLTASDIKMSLLGTPTYYNTQDFINLSQGASLWSGFAITDGGGGAINIGSGTGLIKTTDSGVGANVSFDFAGTTGVSLTDNNTNWVYVDYNAGTPIIAANISVGAINLRTQIVIGRVYRAGTSLSILMAGQFFEEYQTKSCLKDFEVYKFQQASGEAIGETGTRNITVTAGVDYCAHNRITTPAIDTSGSDTFDVWNSSASVMADTTGVTQVDNANYWNGAAVVALTNNRYGTRFFYRAFDGTIHMQYGTSNAVAEATALAETVPVPPAFLRDFALYIGRIVIQEGSSSFAQITNPFETAEEGTQVTDHGDLAGLADDDHSQYALLAGRSGGQTLIGGIGASDNLVLESTTNATKGDVRVSDGTDYVAVKPNAIAIDFNTSQVTTLWKNANSGITTFRIQGNGASNARMELMRGDDSNAWVRFQQLATSAQMSYGSSITQVIWNASNLEVDFKVRGKTDNSLLVIDASSDRIGIGVDTPSEKLEVGGNVKISSGVFSLATGTTINEISVDNTFAAATDDQISTSKATKDYIASQLTAAIGFDAKVTSALTDVTGDGTSYTIIFGTERIDQGNVYNPVTGTFTAPQNGFYSFTYTVGFTDLSTSHGRGQLQINTSNGVVGKTDIDWGNIATSSENLAWTGSAIIYLDTNDTATVSVDITGSTKTIDISALSYFAGVLIK